MSIKITEIVAQETVDLRHRVMWPNKPQKFVILDDDYNGVHFGLWKDLKLISVVSLFIKNDQAQFRKFATEISEQGNGYGTLLLDRLMTYATNKKINKLWCNSRADKTHFYEKFGMYQTSKTFLKEEIRYIVMEKHL